MSRPFGRDEMDARSRPVSCTNAWIGRESRRSEISSREEVNEFATGLGVVTGFAPVLAAFFALQQPS